MSEPDPFKICDDVISLWRDYMNERDVAKEKEAENARLKAEVERLTLENSQYEEHHKYGQNVITSLREEVERLTKHDDDTCRHFIMRNLLEAQNSFLKARVERLTKAGDAMANQLWPKCGCPECEEIIDCWLDAKRSAKEGKQP